MKRMLLLAAAAAAVLTSCMKSEPVGIEQEQQAIGFSAYSSQATRGSVTDLTALKVSNAGFGVIATVVGSATTFATQVAESTAPAPNLMYNQPVAWNGTNSAWEYTPIKYWPESDDFTTNALMKTSFFAYAPYNHSAITLSAGTVAGYPSLTYVTPIAPSAQIDLLADELADVTKPADSKVKFTFRHLLTRIGFSAKSTIANVVTVKSIKINYAANAVTQTAQYTFDGENGVWGDPTAYFAATTNITSTSSDAEQLNGDDVSVKTTATKLNDAGKYMMLIPQRIGAGGLTAFVEYTYAANSADNNSVATYRKAVELPDFTYARGKAYNIILSFAPDKIIFEGIEVENWSEEISVGTIPEVNSTLIDALSSNGNVDLTITGEVSGTTGNTVNIPAAMTAATTPEVSLNFTNVAEDTELTVADLGSDGNRYSGIINVTVPDNVNGLTVTVNAGAATVYINGTLTHAFVTAGSNTCYVGGTVTDLQVNCNTVVMKGGSVGILIAAPGSADLTLTLEADGTVGNLITLNPDPLDPVFTTILAKWDGETTQIPGIANDVYQINNAAQLAWFGGTTVKMNKSADLNVDIDLGNYEWSCINVADHSSAGNRSNAYKDIVFDGNGHTVSNYVIGVNGVIGDTYDGPIGNGGFGLFGAFEGKEFKNLTVKNVVSAVNKKWVAAIIGYSAYNLQTISNCHVENAVIDLSGKYVVAYKCGGIIGYWDSSIIPIVSSMSNCSVKDCTLTSTIECGGLVGYSSTKVDAAYARTFSSCTAENITLNDLEKTWTGYDYTFGCVIGAIGQGWIVFSNCTYTNYKYNGATNACASQTYGYYPDNVVGTDYNVSGTVTKVDPV